MPTEPKRRDTVQETLQPYTDHGVAPPPVREFMPREGANPVEEYRRKVTIGGDGDPVGAPGKPVPPAYPKESGITPGRGPFGGT